MDGGGTIVDVCILVVVLLLVASLLSVNSDDCEAVVKAVSTDDVLNIDRQDSDLRRMLALWIIVFLRKVDSSSSSWE